MWFVALVLWFCSGLGAAGERVFEVEGVVRGPVAEGSVLIEHKDIPGFMPAMTMPFYLGDGEPKVDLSVGDVVKFRLVVGESSSRAERFEVLQDAPDSLVGTRPRSVAAVGHVGEAIPGVKLIDEQGRPLGAVDFEGRYSVVTFIFTRCPVPEFCPLLSSKFGRLQSVFEQSHVDRIANAKLLSVSLDPAFDRPEVLEAYGRRVGAKRERWRFATGETSEVVRLAEFVGLRFSGVGLEISHDLKTMLVGPDGCLVKVWSGNRWSVDEVLEEIGRHSQGF